MAVGHLGILNIGPHLLLQILRQRIHVFQIYRVSRGVNGRRGIIQQHVPVFLRQVPALQAHQRGPLRGAFGVNATGHHALVGPHRPLDQNGQCGTAGSLDELVHWAQIQLAGSRQALRLADVLRVLQLGEGGYPIASGAEVYLKEIADLLADLKNTARDLIKIIVQLFD